MAAMSIAGALCGTEALRNPDSYAWAATVRDLPISWALNSQLIIGYLDSLLSTEMLCFEI